MPAAKVREARREQAVQSIGGGDADRAGETGIQAADAPLDGLDLLGHRLQLLLELLARRSHFVAGGEALEQARFEPRLERA